MLVTKLETKDGTIMAHYRAIKELLGGRTFRHALDMGGGCGHKYYMIRCFAEKVTWLDLTYYTMHGFEPRDFPYEDYIIADMRRFKVPDKFDVVFLLECIQHIPKEDGLKVLKTLIKQGRNIVLTTPSRFWEGPKDQPFPRTMCIWTVGDLSELGFTVRAGVYNGGNEAQYGKAIVAARVEK